MQHLYLNFYEICGIEQRKLLPATFVLPVFNTAVGPRRTTSAVVTTNFSFIATIVLAAIGARSTYGVTATVRASGPAISQARNGFFWAASIFRLARFFHTFTSYADLSFRAITVSATTIRLFYFRAQLFTIATSTGIAFRTISVFPTTTGHFVRTQFYTTAASTGIAFRAVSIFATTVGHLFRPQLLTPTASASISFRTIRVFTASGGHLIRPKLHTLTASTSITLGAVSVFTASGGNLIGLQLHALIISTSIALRAIGVLFTTDRSLVWL